MIKKITALAMLATLNANSNEIIDSLPTVNNISNVYDDYTYIEMKGIYSEQSLTVNNVNYSTDNDGLGIEFGYAPNPFIAYAAFVSAYSDIIYDNERTEQEPSFGASFKISTDNRKPFFVYAKAEYEFASAEKNNSRIDDEVINFGAGAGFSFEKIYLTFEITSGDSEDYDLSRKNYTVSVGRKFK